MGLRLIRHELESMKLTSDSFQKNTARGGPLVAAGQPPLHFCQSSFHVLFHPFIPR